MSVVVFVAGAASLPGLAQNPVPLPAQATTGPNVTFTVASIRRNSEEEAARGAILQKDPNAPIPPGRAQTRPGGQLVGRGMSVRELIRDAYGYRNRAAADVIGGPNWIDSERYDVQAKADLELPASSILGLPPEAESALRALLAERMRLQVRVERRRQRVYEMVMARDDRRPGPNLVQAKGGCRSFYAREPQPAQPAAGQATPGQPAPVRPCAMGVSLARVVAENMTMEEWARFLAAFPQIDATVIDRTGLSGAFDFTVTNPAANDPDASPLLPAVQPLLESQLGLRLRSTEAEVEVLVIQRVERPTGN